MKLLSLLVFSITLTSCVSMNTFAKDEDWYKTSDGERNWTVFIKRVNVFIEIESKGHPLPDKAIEKENKDLSEPGRPSLYTGIPCKDWNDFWGRHIIILDNTQENSEKYILYIIQKRRSRGLPELVIENPDGIRK